jgi:phosphoenolpyruvate synthase/pyruvate phosphate dikinase
VGELSTTYLGKHDIIILNGIPNDVSVVAGIITTEFQTPLSHINILSHNRRTPNMALRDGWSNPKFNSLIGELVYLKVEADSFTIRKAMPKEAIDFWNRNEPQTIRVLEKDETTSGLIDLSAASYSSVKLIGGKAANFAELLKLSNPKIPTPENPFAIPFYYYVQHIKSNHIQPFIDEMLADETFKTNQDYRKAKLLELQNKITSAAINPNFVELVRNKIGNFSDFAAYRFRSSTNAEDLEDFSGAGLYDSYSAKKDDENKSIENAIKKVWASLWNFRAFEEREYYKIDHLSAVMGILVHRSFPDENANGVVITKNLYNVNPGFIVNAQFDENSIVFPEPGIMHDQLILYTYSISNSTDFTIEYLSHSNIREFNGQNVLTNDELYLLGAYCLQIKQHYFYKVPHKCNCLFDDFGLDIEFKIDSSKGKRKLYIKQIRLYN